MKKEHCFGADISKLTVDLVLYNNGRHLRIENNSKGYKSFLKQINKEGISKENCFVLMEHTGLYSAPFERFLVKENIPFSKISGLQIKLSQGIVRGKSDKVDAKKIAAYAHQNQDKLKEIVPSKEVEHLKMLLNLRERLVTERAGYKVSLKEEKAFLDLPSASRIFKTQQKLIKVLDQEIEELEEEIETVLSSEGSIKKNYKLLKSIIGVGMIVASYMIVYTNNFLKFTTARKFASYSGVAPFPYQSGTSIRGKTKVNHMANKRAKTLLDLAAKSALVNDPELRSYYLRKVEEGKEKMKVVNAIRNKLLGRMFAVIKRGTAFERNYQQAC